MSLERETGVINGQYSSDALFLRQVILDGQWDTALDFVQPLCNSSEFNVNLFRYYITKYKYFELLCLNQEPGPLQNSEITVEEVVECLKSLESLCPNKKEYNELCLLLTLSKPSDHSMLKSWNPSSARVECFNAVYPLVRQFLALDKKDLSMPFAKDDRLVQLLLKGLFYESCVELCQNRAVRQPVAPAEMSASSSSTASELFSGQVGRARIPRLLNADNHKLCDADLSLVTWLDVVPDEIFSLPFEQKALELRLLELRKPVLDALWTEQILQTPIKPLQFPHAAVPTTSRFRSADKLSRSMMPFDGLHTSFTAGIGGRSASPFTGRRRMAEDELVKLTQSLIMDATRGLSHSMISGGFQLNRQQPNGDANAVALPATTSSLMTQSIDHAFGGPETHVSAGSARGGPVGAQLSIGAGGGDIYFDSRLSETVPMLPPQPVPMLLPQQMTSSSMMAVSSSSMHQSVYDQLEEIKRRSLQQSAEDISGAATAQSVVRMRQHRSPTPGSPAPTGVAVAPSLPPLLENAIESTMTTIVSPPAALPITAANVAPPPDGTSTKLYTEFQRQRAKKQPQITPTQSPTHVNYSLAKMAAMQQSFSGAGAQMDPRLAASYYQVSALGSLA